MTDLKMNATKNVEIASNIPFDPAGLQQTAIISDELRNILELCMRVVLIVTGFMGVITNIINIRVFVEQGVRNDSTGIGFVFLSVTDLLGCAMVIPSASCFVARFTENGPANYQICTAYATITIFIHTALNNMSTWTTVYISLMRCLCVLFPLKVKSIFTPTVTIIVIVLIIIIFSIAQTMYSGFTTLVWGFNPKYNTTVAYIKDSPMAQLVLHYHQIITNQTLPILALIIVTINTVLLTQKLIEVKKWRLKNSSDSAKDGKENSSNPSKNVLSAKDIEMIKFINTTTSIFLVCVLMGFIPGIAVTVFPDVSFTGLNRNFFLVSFLSRFMFNSINSSINFFFYIRVSSRFKSAFASSFNSCSKPS